MRWISTTEAAPFVETALPTTALSATTTNFLSLHLDGTRHQPWEGAGGCFNELGWEALQLLSQPDREAVIRDLFDPQNGCRFNLCRMPIGASDYARTWYSLNETDGDLAMEHFSIARDQGCLIPYITAARQHADLALFASPWSPPTWMKHPKSYNHGTLVWTTEIRKAYAHYFVRFIQAYRAAGVPVHQIHVQNEPLSEQKFPSCKWTGQQLREFIRDDLVPALRQAGETTEAWLGTLNGSDNGDDFPDYLLAALTDPSSRAAISGVGLQWYQKRAMPRLWQSFPDLRVYQTENECGDGKNTWAYALYVFNLMQHYISHGARAYVYWNMVLQPGGRSSWGWEQNSMITVDPVTRTAIRNPEFHVMKHLSAFVAPGATRLGMAGEWSGQSFAFANLDGSTVAVFCNPLDEARIVRVELGGDPVVLKLAPRSFHTLVA